MQCTQSEAEKLSEADLGSYNRVLDSTAVRMYSGTGTCCWLQPFAEPAARMAAALVWWDLFVGSLRLGLVVGA